MPSVRAGSRVWGYAFSAVVVGAVLWPLLGDPRDDSFPLSTYLMFSGRGSAVAEVSHAVGVRADGTEVRLPPGAIANDEVVQAYETARQAVAQGPEATRRLCEKAAAWASGERLDVVAVEVRTDTFDAVAYFDGEEEPMRSEVHASCAVR